MNIRWLKSAMKKGLEVIRALNQAYETDLCQTGTTKTQQATYGYPRPWRQGWCQMWDHFAIPSKRICSFHESLSEHIVCCVKHYYTLAELLIKRLRSFFTSSHFRTRHCWLMFTITQNQQFSPVWCQLTTAPLRNRSMWPFTKLPLLTHQFFSSII